MAGYIEWDDRELRRLEVDLTEAPGRVQRHTREGVLEGAKDIKREQKIDATGHKGNWFGKPGTSYRIPLSKHVSYDMLSEFEAEIGIEYKGAGRLARILVNGSVNNSPAYDFDAAHKRALPRIERRFADAAESSVLGGGGFE